jgi:hypothetical protein
MVLTGTPMVNQAADIFGILKFLYPDKFTSYGKFCSEYFNIHNFIYRFKSKSGRNITINIPKPLGYKSWQHKKKLQKFINTFSVCHKQEEVMP